MSNSPLIRTQARTTSRLVPTQHIRAALGVVLLFTFLAAGYTVLEPVTGFGKRELWDWLSLGGVSLTIFLVGLLITRRQKEREEVATLEHTQDAALAAYLDQMSDLMIDQQLGKPRKDKDSLEDSVRNVAQARTVAVLLGLDKDHKRRPLKLVYELRLIDTDKPVLKLRNAALDGANLSELTLRKAYLKGVDLRGADLQGADLESADLTLADLRGADLSRADLSRVNLTLANLLPYDEQGSARWSLHSLGKNVDLNKEDFRPRNRLVGTKLREAILIEAQLCDAWLGGADLTGAKVRNADLTGAQLKGANLNYADLEGAKGITTEELERQAYSLEGATMPSGQKFEDWLNAKVGRKDEGENASPS
jgi:hypothetical protein